jgi:hypothetical protein
MDAMYKSTARRGMWQKEMKRAGEWIGRYKYLLE